MQAGLGGCLVSAAWPQQPVSVAGPRTSFTIPARAAKTTARIGAGIGARTAAFGGFEGAFACTFEDADGGGFEKAFVGKKNDPRVDAFDEVLVRGHGQGRCSVGAFEEAFVGARDDAAGRFKEAYIGECEEAFVRG